MGKSKGDPKKNWAEAVKSAADKADKPGTYTLTTEQTAAPIRDYIVTLDGPK